MRPVFLTILVFFCTVISFAQQDVSKDLFVFRITDYMVKLNDSVTLVQVELSEGGVGIKQGQVALLKPNNNFTETDTAKIGSGKCQLIKGTYYYFGIKLSRKDRLPKKDDLLYTFINYPASYKGQVFKLLQQDIYLERVGGGRFYTFAFPVFGDRAQESSVIDSLVDDIKYTGSEMLKQGNGQDRLISKGKFRDKKLFTAMQEITAADVREFIDYVIARPQRYAGHNWKVSEVFATWMDGGAPTVIRQP